jgi:hypothetical protein
MNNNRRVYCKTKIPKYAVYVNDPHKAEEVKQNSAVTKFPNKCFIEYFKR